MKINFDVTYKDGRKARVTAHPGSFVTYEKTHRASISESASMTAITWLAWHASGCPITFDEWLETTDDITKWDEDSGPLDEGESTGTPPYGG